MLYQLPSGKTIYITIEEYLNLTDADIQYLVASNSGDTIINPFQGSAVQKNAKERSYDFTDYHNDDDIEKRDTEISPEDLDKLQ